MTFMEKQRDARGLFFPADLCMYTRNVRPIAITFGTLVHVGRGVLLGGQPTHPIEGAPEPQFLGPQFRH